MFSITIKCNKDLVNDSGHKDFTKGKEYVAEGYKITEKTFPIKDMQLFL